MNTIEHKQTASYLANAKTSFKPSHRKEGKCFFESRQIIDLDAETHNGEAHSIVDLRLYGTGNKNFACLWIHLPGNTRTGNPFPNGLYVNGSGSAGGYGYHRPSAAAQEAIENAGFRLSKEIGGVGESAIDEALLAIVAHLGIRRLALIRSHA